MFIAQIMQCALQVNCVIDDTKGRLYPFVIG